jgi:hypothetical protein
LASSATAATLSDLAMCYLHVVTRFVRSAPEGLALPFEKGP